MVQIHPDPPSSDRGCSSVGRAPALQAGGHRFDPVQLHQGWAVSGKAIVWDELGSLRTVFSVLCSPSSVLCSLTLWIGLCGRPLAGSLAGGNSRALSPGPAEKK